MTSVAAKPEPDRGAELQRKTKEMMQHLEMTDTPLVIPENHPIMPFAKEVMAWFEAMNEPDTVPVDIQKERPCYYRALFNMTTDKRTRLALVNQLDALKK